MRKICELNEGDYITDVVGPLGQATHIEKVGTVVCANRGHSRESRTRTTG